VTKLEGGEVVEPRNLFVNMIAIKENLIPYTRERRHLCGGMESNDNKGAIGILNFP
jgi:hypothetical protein